MNDTAASATITVVRNGQTVRQYKKMFRDSIYSSGHSKASVWLDRELFILKA